MNSNHSTTIEQTALTNWLELAKRKWGGAAITGSGPHSVRLMDGKNIRLFERFENAMEFCSQSSAYKYLDLSKLPIKPCRTIPEPFDVDEMRRERRAARAQGKCAGIAHFGDTSES